MTPHRGDPDQALLERAVRVQAISAEITALEDPEAIPARVVEALVRELGLAVASVVLRDPDTGALRYAADIGVPTEVKALGFRPGGTAATVMATGEALFIEHPDDARVSPQTRPHFQAWACLPIRHRGRTYGLLFVNFPEPHAFPPIERHILATFASQTAIALDNARLHQAERRRAAALATLAALGRDLSESLNTADLVRILARTLREHLTRASLQALWVATPEGLQPVLAAGWRCPPEALPTLAPSGSRLVAALGSQAGPRTVPWETLREDLALPAEALPVPGPVVGLRLLAAGEVQGLLVLGFPGEAEPPSPPELDFLQALADRGALALHNAALYARSLQEARRDSLTQVLNHGAFQARLAEALADAHLLGSSLALLMLDADHFKACNDRHGHAFGDRVLVALARAVREQVRPTDTVGRWGGEEFAVLLTGVEGATALRVAERIRSTMEGLTLPLPSGEAAAAPTVSLGVATFPVCGDTPEALVDAADAALYRAKAEGRNRVCAAPGVTLPGR